MLFKYGYAEEGKVVLLEGSRIPRERDMRNYHREIQETPQLPAALFTISISPKIAA